MTPTKLVPVAESEFLTNLRKELLLSKMTHSFSLTRDELIEVLCANTADRFTLAAAPSVPSAGVVHCRECAGMGCVGIEQDDCTACHGTGRGPAPTPQAGPSGGAVDGLDFEPDEQHAVPDMANVGYSLLQAIKLHRPGYCWNESPAEIVGDLCNELEEAQPATGSDAGGDAGLTVKQAWWAGARAGLGLPADTPRTEVAAAIAAQAKEGK